ALSSRSTFGSSEAKVAIMVAGVELQQKLLQRLRMLSGEAPQTDVDKKPSPLKSSPDEGRLEELFGEEARLRQQVLEARMQRDAARTRRRQIEKESLGHHSNTAKDIARYHCQLQSLQNDIAMNKQEFNVLRQQCRNKESQQLQARKLKEEAALCKAQKANLVAAVETETKFVSVSTAATRLAFCALDIETKRVAALRAEMKTWEQRLKEALERKVVAEAEALERRMSKAAGENDETVPKFTMSSDSDHGEEDEEEEEEEASSVMDDLELSYEGLELSSLMPFPSAVRLAAGHVSDHEAMSKVDIPETGFLERGGVEFGRWTRPSPSGNAEWTEEELEAEYGEHLRNLEKVLLEIRQEQAEQAEERRCQSRLAALKQKKKEEAAAAAAAAQNRFPWSLGKWMRVAIMVAGVELQQKLLQRLRMLPGEAPQAQTDVDKKPSPLKSSPDEGRLEELFGEEARLRQQVLEARKQRDAARTRRRQIEKESLGHHSNTAKDIAGYHCQLQSLQNDITMNKQEFNVLRQQCRNKESQQLQARKLKDSAALCKAQKAQVAAEVETETKRVAALRAEVTTWEQRLKEVLARKVVAEAQAMERRMLKAAGENDETVPKFTMNTDSDHGEEDEEEEGNIMDDLELSYEGLELSSLMPLPLAVRLAAGHISDHEAMSKVDIPETGFLERGGVEFGRWTRPSPSGNAEWTEEELEAEY
ncbi:unnamed protein product, partial [Symbiodinium microadriaticum]